MWSSIRIQYIQSSQVCSFFQLHAILEEEANIRNRETLAMSTSKLFFLFAWMHDYTLYCLFPSVSALWLLYLKYKKKSPCFSSFITFLVFTHMLNKLQNGFGRPGVNLFFIWKNLTHRWGPIWKHWQEQHQQQNRQCREVCYVMQNKTQVWRQPASWKPDQINDPQFGYTIL